MTNPMGRRRRPESDSNDPVSDIAIEGEGQLLRLYGICETISEISHGATVTKEHRSGAENWSYMVFHGLIFA